MPAGSLARSDYPTDSREPGRRPSFSSTMVLPSLDLSDFFPPPLPFKTGACSHAPHTHAHNRDTHRHKYIFISALVSLLSNAAEQFPGMQTEKMSPPPLHTHTHTHTLIHSLSLFLSHLLHSAQTGRHALWHTYINVCTV